LRNFTLFGLFAFPLLAENLAYLLPERAQRATWLKGTCVGILLLLILLFASGEMHKVYAYPPRALGLAHGSEGAANFFLGQGLRGPIFNNYDVGGYLIYHLYPKEKVFVDNRPEAYPSSFFTETYIPMQENEALWSEQAERFGFNVLFFSHRDLTPWAQRFLIARIDDPLWAPVYADEFAVIFLRRTPENSPVIERFEIPRERFIVAPR